MDEVAGGVDEAGTGRPRGLTVGFVPGVTLTKWRRTWAERYPRTPLEVLEVAPAEQRAVLEEGRVDVCFARLPLEREGLHVIPLYEEVPVVVVPRDHPVAVFEEVSLADLADEDVVDPDAPADVMDLVAGGAGVAFVPHSVARSRSRRDLVYRPVSDAEPTTIGLCWRRDDDNPLIEDLVGVVRGRTVNSSRTRQSGGTAPARPKQQRGRVSETPRRPQRRRGRSSGR
ncbi:LysR family substrate-binding domain-containing protein [Auraticoccus cholistanensis]|nr:LysR family substrate-binding domain-containing protein [Auraticoccus cholistanensis]